MQFGATLQLDGKTATGIRVPDEIVSVLGGGNRPRVRVKLAGHSYQTTVARMRGEFKFPVSAAVREKPACPPGTRGNPVKGADQGNERDTGVHAGVAPMARGPQGIVKPALWDPTCTW